MSNFVGIPFSFSSNFSFLSHVFINIDVYKKIDSIFTHLMKGQCLSINLVTSFVLYCNYRLKFTYKIFCMYTPLMSLHFFPDLSCSRKYSRIYKLDNLHIRKSGKSNIT